MHFSQEQVISGQLLTRLVIRCVDNVAFNGSFDHNLYNFKNYDLTQLNVNLDRQQQFVRPIELNYGANQNIASYMLLFNGMELIKRTKGMI